MRQAAYKALMDWQQKRDAGEQVEPFVLRKQTVTEVKIEGDPADRIRSFTVSTAAEDRDGDTVAVAGWHLDNYRKNPVVLWAHDYHQLPVAQSLSCTVVGNALKSVDQFAPRDIYPFADTVLQLLDGGYLRATSVGFIPLKWVYNEQRGGGGGWFCPVDFIEQEKLEHSIVPVPSNPEALADAKSKGIDVSPIREWAERALDEWSEEKGIWLPKSQVERVLKLLDTRSFHAGAALKGALPFHETPKADEGEAWDGPAEVAAASVDDLKQMCAWVDPDHADIKSGYKLPHHKHDGEHAVVWKGVAAAGAALMGSRGGVSIPDGDVAAVKAHLQRHYAQFDRTAPWEDDSDKALSDDLYDLVVNEIAMRSEMARAAQ